MSSSLSLQSTCTAGFQSLWWLSSKRGPSCRSAWLVVSEHKEQPPEARSVISNQSCTPPPPHHRHRVCFVCVLAMNLFPFINFQLPFVWLLGKSEAGKVWQREDEDEEILTLFLPRMTKTISSQKNMAMTTDPIGTISSTLVFSSAPKVKENNVRCRSVSNNLTTNRTNLELTLWGTTCGSRSGMLIIIWVACHGSVV